MYVSRPLSVCLSNPSAAASGQPEGPNGGYLILQDDSTMARQYFRLFKDSNIEHFPFPQNKLQVLSYGTREHRRLHHVYFIPAINNPLLSNIYYVIKADGKHKGKACTSSNDKETTSCCFGKCIKDVDPIPLYPNNTYQQFVMVPKDKAWKSWAFETTSVAHDGHPPHFLRRKGWGLYHETPNNFSLGEAKGMDLELRARLPNLNFSVNYKSLSDPVVVGKWYCPFMFIEDQVTPIEQVDNSMYYEMTLEQQWEQIFYRDNVGSKNKLLVDVGVPDECVMVLEVEALHLVDDRDGMVWYSTIDEKARIGLSLLIVERMKWEQRRVGWVSNEGNQGKVLKIDEFGGVGKWERYGCYILVERFVLRRMNGTVLLTYSFKHTHHIRSKWEN